MKMYFVNTTIILLIFLSTISREAQCVYLKQSIQTDANSKNLQYQQENTAMPWNLVKIKLGLNDRKIQILKSQKDQKATMDLVKQFIKENPNSVYTTANSPSNHYIDEAASNAQSEYLNTYHTIVHTLENSKPNKLKTVIRLEMNDVLKRSPRRISLQMVSDMPSDKIDDLLKEFNKQHDLDKDDERSYDDGDEDDELYDADYADMDDSSDYVQENHYEHDQDQSAIGGDASNYKYNSISDLIMQSQRMQRHRDDMKIQQPDKKYLI